MVRGGGASQNRVKPLLYAATCRHTRCGGVQDGSVVDLGPSWVLMRFGLNLGLINGAVDCQDISSLGGGECVLLFGKTGIPLCNGKGRLSAMAIFIF